MHSFDQPSAVSARVSWSLGSLSSHDSDENVTWQWTIGKWRLFCDYSFLLAPFIVDRACCKWTGRSAVKLNIENERCTAVCSRWRQNLKFGNFTLSFGRRAQGIRSSACGTCSTIIFAHSTNQIIVFWRPCCRCRGPCLSSLLSSKRRTSLLMLSSSAESGRKLKSNETMYKETLISFRSVGKISPNSRIYRSLKPKCSMSSKYQKDSYRPYAARFRFLSLHRRVNHAAKEKQKELIKDKPIPTSVNL